MEFLFLTKRPLKQEILICILHAIYGSQIKGMSRLKFNFFFNYTYITRSLKTIIQNNFTFHQQKTC
jgi:hypothetical protein